MKNQKLKNIIFNFLLFVVLYIPFELAKASSKWFLLLWIPLLLILAKLEEFFLREEAPPMPKLPWSDDKKLLEEEEVGHLQSEVEQIKSTLDGNGIY